MNRISVGTRHAMPVQPVFIVGTYNEDGTPDFAPITWVSKTCLQDEENMIVISMYGNKQTKLNVLRTGMLTLNLAHVDMLPLVDYFGQTPGNQGVKDGLEYTWRRASLVNAPTLDASRWVCECEAVQSIKTGFSDTFFCRIHDIQIDESIAADGFGIDLTQLGPVVYSGDYHSVGQHLGTIGDYFTR